MALARVRTATKRVIEFAQRVVSTVPVVRSIVTGLVRIELIDRSMAIAAQAMLALVPLMVVLTAFLPPEVTDLALDRFRDLTGIGEGGILHEGLVRQAYTAYNAALVAEVKKAQK